MTRSGWPAVDRSRLALLAGLAIDNVGSGLFLPLSLLYATRVVGLDVGLAGALVGALLLTVDSDTALRWIVGLDAGTFAVAALLLAAFVVTEPVEHSGRGAEPLAALRDRRYLALIVSSCLVGLAVDFALVGTPVFVLDVLDGPPWLPGALLAGGTVLSSVYGLRVVDALRGQRRTWSLQLGAWLFVTWAVLTVLLIWLPAGWLVPYACATAVLWVVGTKVFFPVSGALSEALPPRGGRAGYMAMYQYAFTTAHVLAPAVVALFAVTAWLPWAVVTAASLAGVGVLAWLGRAIPATLDRSSVPVAPGTGGA